MITVSAKKTKPSKQTPPYPVIKIHKNSDTIALYTESGNGFVLKSSHYPSLFIFEEWHDTEENSEIYYGEITLKQE